MIQIKRSDLNDIIDQYLVKLKNAKRYNKKKDNVLQNHWVKHLDRIVKSDDLQGIINEFDAQDQSGMADFKKYMIGQYETLFYTEKIGAWLARTLDIKTCPYCNRQYTFTIDKGTKRIRPEIDHFYSKSDYPYLALSFYNLIPSCPICNHTKSDDETDINPYYDGFNDNFKFRIKTKDGSENSLNWALEKEIEIDFSKTNRNIGVFALKELYNEHIDYVEEIIDKAQAYNKQYYNSLIDTYKGLGKQEAEIERIIWGNYIENAEHEKRPLSKLTKDILEQLKIK